MDTFEERSERIERNMILIRRLIVIAAVLLTLSCCLLLVNWVLRSVS